MDDATTSCAVGDLFPTREGQLMRITTEIRRLRAKWTFRGHSRPSWALTPGVGQESVWDYPRPPRIESDSRRIRIRCSGRSIAESTHALRVLETGGPPTFYLRQPDIRMDLLRPNETRALCEWKGNSVGLDLIGGPNDVAWRYVETFEAFDAISGWIAFHPSKVECFVGEERARPQLGNYYGGWITNDVVGPFKGDPDCEER